ncbi:MAG: hypothetical protein IAE91_15200, partial [Ignavibacteriaceae bacterium]|nr:hypothetical protein [Ignavibacteriaceae bacterium]
PSSAASDVYKRQTQAILPRILESTDNQNNAYLVLIRLIVLILTTFTQKESHKALLMLSINRNLVFRYAVKKLGV